MNCKEIEKMIPAFLEDELDTEDLHDFIEHIEKCKEIAESKKYKLQFKRAVAGGNDAGAIHSARGGVRTLAISMPCRYLHSQLSLISKSDIDDVYNIAKDLAFKLAEGRV